MQAAISRLLLPSCEIVGFVDDTAALLEMTRRLRPDVVLLDVSLRGEVNALEATRRIKQSMPDVQIVAVTAHDDEDIKHAAFDAGMSGYVGKLHLTDELARTVHVVADAALGLADDGPS